MSPSPTFRIGRMRQDDASAVAKMMRGLAAFHGETTPTTAKHFVAYALGRNKITNVLVAKVQGKPVGFIEFHYLANFRRGFKSAHAGFFYVEEKFRGQGVGFALLQAAVSASLTDDCKRFVIGADAKNKLSNAYYAKLGWAQASADHYDYKADEGMMHKLVRQKL